MYSIGMPLLIVEAVHVRVVCDGCGNETAELCAKREIAVTARAIAAHKFRGYGWHQDPRTERSREREAAEHSGDGRWYCPACSKRTHL
jgi:hypothetical protein